MKLEYYLDGKNYIYLIHLNYGSRQSDDRREHWEFGKKNHLIGLDRSDVNMDWNNKTEAEKKNFRSHSPQWHSQFEMFCNKIAKNDFVVAMAGYDLFLGFGIISQNEYEFSPKLKRERIFFDHVRQIDWTKAWDYDNSLKLSKPLRGFNRTLLKIGPDHKFWKILANTEI